MSAEIVSTNETRTPVKKTTENVNENAGASPITPDNKNNRMSIVLNKTKRFGLLSIEHLI